MLGFSSTEKKFRDAAFRRSDEVLPSLTKQQVNYCFCVCDVNKNSEFPSMHCSYISAYEELKSDHELDLGCGLSDGRPVYMTSESS